MEIWHPHFAQVGRTTAFTSIGKQDLDLLAHKLLIPGMSLLRKDRWRHLASRWNSCPRKTGEWRLGEWKPDEICWFV